jgi:hypothetical protein
MLISLKETRDRDISDIKLLSAKHVRECHYFLGDFSSFKKVGNDIRHV